MFRRQTQIGASISDSSIELVEVQTDRKGGATLSSFSIGSLEPGIVEHGKVADVDRLAATLRSMLEAKDKFSTKELVVALPESTTFFHRFHLVGQFSGTELLNTLEFQAEEVFPFALKDVVDDFQVIGRAAGSVDVLYAVAPQEIVEGYKQVVAKAGAHLIGLTLEPVALRRLFVPTNGKGKATLIADIGERATNLTIADGSGVRASFTQLDGGSQWTDAVAKALKCPLEKAEEAKRARGVGTKADKRVVKALAPFLDALTSDIAKAASWYAETHEGEIETCVLTGGASQMPGLADALVSRFASRGVKLTVRTGELGNVLSETAVGARAKQVSGTLAPAIGAAMQGMNSKDPFIDFTRSHTGRNRAPTLARSQDGEEGTKPKRFERLFGRQSSRSKLLLAALLIGVVIAVAAAYWVMTHPRTFMTSAGLSGQSFSADIDFDTTAANAGAVPARLVALDPQAQTISVTPSETQPRDAVATGTVTITDDSDTNQSLVATTRLLADSGVLFRLKQAVTVPAHGQVDAPIYADQPGDAGDISASHFIVPGLPTERQAVVYAASSQPTTGGVEQVGVLSQADVDAAVPLAEERIRAGLGDSVLSLLSAGEGWDSSLADLHVVSSIPSVAVGTETAYAEVVVTIQPSLFLFDQAELETALRTAAVDQTGADASEAAGLSVNTGAFSGAQFGPNDASATATVSFGLYPQ